MRIALNFLQLYKNGSSQSKDFIVETLFLLIRQHPEHTFIIITNQKLPDTSYFLPNTEVVIIKNPPQNLLLKKLWGDVKMRRILKKAKADVLLVFENDSPVTTAVPKCIMVSGIKKIRPGNIKNAQSLVVLNKSVKQELIKKHKTPTEKVFVLYPYPGKIFKPVESESRENIKSEYSDGLEYFLYNSILEGRDFVKLLKSFSHFKKRQQSRFKLLLLTQSSPSFEKTLSNYKYRSDVTFIQAKNRNDESMLVASAYAVALPFDANEDMFAALNAMQAGVPVITAADSIVNEIADNASANAEPGTIKDIGDKMIRVYTDESYRSELIDRGKTIAAKFTPERSADILWQSIMKALP